VVALVEDSFNFLSKMCLGRMRQAAVEMTRMAHRRGLATLVAGSDPTDEPELYLAAGAGAVLLGEPDHTLPEAVAATLHGAPALHEVAGLALPGPAGVARTPARGPERRPDVLPWPAWDLADVDAYRRVWTEAHGYFSMNMASTRGCPFHCNWCAKPIWGQRYAMRSPWDVAAEMAHLKRTFAPDHIWFADDIFGLRPAWTVEFARAVIDLDGALPFQVQSRVDLLTDAAVDGLARAGCVEVWMGVESGSQPVLDAMEKGIRVEDVPPAVERLRRRGIRACFFLQFGYPGEEWADIQATVDLVRSVLPDEIGISVSYPLPGTRFYGRVQRQLGAKTHWDDSNDLAMMFQGTYTTDFYKTLHGLLHDDLDARLALARAPDGVRPADEEKVADVQRRWSQLAAQAPSLRSPQPTLLPRLRSARPAPDLSLPAN
jgi:anaerobic magnesium-protoporphyrin IX monomethyl ester cyclase